MQSRNPVFNRSEAFSPRGYGGVNQAPPVAGEQLEDMYNAPAATGLQTGRMTIDDVVVKTGLMFAVLVPLAGLSFYLKNPALIFGGLIVGLILGLIVSFKQSTNPALILAYAAAEGLFIGGISAFFESAVGWHRRSGRAGHPVRLRGRAVRLQERSGAGHAEGPAHRADRDRRLPGLLPDQHGDRGVHRQQPALRLAGHRDRSVRHHPGRLLPDHGLRLRRAAVSATACPSATPGSRRSVSSSPSCGSTSSSCG